MRKFSSSLLFILVFGFSAVATGSNLDNQNPEQIESLEKSASAGNEKAQMKLAIMYLDGNGVSADISKALFYYRMAAEQNVAFAQYRLARIYLDGDHVNPDPNLGLEWLLSAARLGFVEAQLDLSRSYEQGDGIAQDLVESYKWLSVASSLTDMDLKSRQDELEAKMTFVELAQAVSLSRICILTGYEDC